MDASQMKSRALDVARKAGIDGEQAIATHEGTAAETGVVAEWADLSVPGADLLRGKSRRIVLVTDQMVRVFDGRRFGKLGEQLGAYPVSDDVLAYDDQRLIFPDGQSVVLNELQAREIVAATGGVLNYARANYALRRLGVLDEAGLGSATGDVQGSAHRTALDVAGDIALAWRAARGICGRDSARAGRPNGHVSRWSRRRVQDVKGCGQSRRCCGAGEGCRGVALILALLEPVCQPPFGPSDQNHEDLRGA